MIEETAVAYGDIYAPLGIAFEDVLLATTTVYHSKTHTHVLVFTAFSRATLPLREGMVDKN